MKVTFSNAYPYDNKYLIGGNGLNNLNKNNLAFSYEIIYLLS